MRDARLMTKGGDTHTTSISASEWNDAIYQLRADRPTATHTRAECDQLRRRRRHQERRIDAECHPADDITHNIVHAL